jgi:polysaccharide biosynthesis protein PslH
VRILFLSTLLPGAMSTGSEVATQGFVDALRSLGHRVTLLGYRRAGSHPPMHSDDVDVGERHIETVTAGGRAAAWMARALATRRPYSVAKYVTRAYAKAVEDQLARLDPDLIVLDHAQMGWLVPRGGWPAPFVYLAHNVEHRLHSELAGTGGLGRRAHAREAGLIRGVEERLCREASAVWSLTAEEAEELGELGGEVRFFDLPASATPSPPGPPSRDVAILGGWTWKSNAAGLEWFLREVRPRLSERVEVHVAGAQSVEIAGGVPGVTAHGRVPDALEFLQTARVIAVPSIAGAGVQVKTLDAIASGRRVVATPTGMRGLSEAPPTVDVARDPGDFARALERGVTADADEEIARIGREWAAARSACFHEQLAEALEETRG